jgi:hypothetical protein
MCMNILHPLCLVSLSLFLCVCVRECVCVYHMYACCLHRSEKRALDLQLKMVGSCLVCAGN